MSPGWHRRPRRFVVWGQSTTRAVFGGTGGSLARLFRSGQKARLAALDAEVVALRVTVAQMREAVAAAEAAATALTAELAASRDLLTAPAQGPAAMPVAGPNFITRCSAIPLLSHARIAYDDASWLTNYSVRSSGANY